MENIIIEVPQKQHSRKKSWRKLLTSVDRSQSNGYAFVGDWLTPAEKAEVPAGSLILCYDESGSRKNWYPRIRVLRVESDGELTEVYQYEGDTNERSWALSVRDKIADLIDSGPDEEALRAERERLIARLAEIDAALT